MIETWPVTHTEQASEAPEPRQPDDDELVEKLVRMAGATE